jgi:hypothetical protein
MAMMLFWIHPPPITIESSSWLPDNELWCCVYVHLALRCPADATLLTFVQRHWQRRRLTDR